MFSISNAFNNLNQSSSIISEFYDSRQPLTIQDTQPRSPRESYDKPTCRLCLSTESFGEVFDEIFDENKDLPQQIFDLSGVQVKFAKFSSPSQI